MKILSGRFLTAISALILSVVPVKNTISCGPELDPDFSMFMLFRQDMAEAGLQRFNYSNHFLASGSIDPEHNDVHRNCREWAAATGYYTTPKEVYSIVYSLSPDEFLYSVKTGDWKKLEDNHFIKWLTRKENKEWLSYLAFARLVEFGQMPDKDPWESGSEYCPKCRYDSLIDAAQIKCSSHINPFLKERYAFQAVKMIYYLNDCTDIVCSGIVQNEDSTLINWYDKYLKGKNTIVADWGLLYYALAHKDRFNRALNLLRAFDRTYEKKDFVYNHLSLNDTRLLENRISSPHELAALNTYIAIKNPGKALKQIQAVFKYDPGSRYLPLLTGREVNKLEDWILTPRESGFNSPTRENIFMQRINNRYSGESPDTGYGYFAKKNIQKDKEYLFQLRQYMESVSGKSGKNNDFILLAIAHLYVIEGKYADARKYLASLHHFSNPAFEKQLNIEKTIALIYNSNLAADTTRIQLDSAFEGLEKAGIVGHKNTQPYNDYIIEQTNQNDITKDMLGELYLLLANKLKGCGDIVTSGLLFQKAKVPANEFYGEFNYISSDTENYYFKIAWFDKYGSPEDIDRLLKLKHKKNKTPFEKRITGISWASDDFYRDLKGTILTRQGKYEEALQVMNGIPDSFWLENYEYINHLKVKSVSDVGTLLPVENGLPIKYPMVSKKLILNDIVSLRKAVKTAINDSARASLYFLLGNCYYNITYYGKDWMMYSYGKTEREKEHGLYEDEYKWAYYNFYPNSIKYGRDYYECRKAIDMYLKALKYCHKQKELQAECLLMLGKCDVEAHDYIISQRKLNKYIYYPNQGNRMYYSTYFEQLRKNCSGTIVFERSSTECPDVEDYLKAHKG